MLALAANPDFTIGAWVSYLEAVLALAAMWRQYLHSLRCGGSTYLEAVLALAAMCREQWWCLATLFGSSICSPHCWEGAWCLLPYLEPMLVPCHGGSSSGAQVSYLEAVLALAAMWCEQSGVLAC
jgi:hypothetical protein